MANDNNNAKNLEALAKLKELGITDLSPEAVLAMVQSHLDTQSNLRKDNCQKQKEIDAKKAEIASQQDELILPKIFSKTPKILFKINELF